ncbi:MAG TPA: NAD-binding protein [Burkholderiales bacterium]
MSNFIFLALRRLRAPIIAFVLVFAVGAVGLALIPGVDAEGRAWHMSLSQALYFMTYTATTIGFGEIPHPFSDAQRLWVTAMIFASVLGWAYLLASLMRLSRDRAFRHAIDAARFRHAVTRIDGPYYLVCGVGETGMLVCRALDTLGYRFVAIDIDPARTEVLDVAGLGQEPPALAADARLPGNLLRAGLARTRCRGVIALTNDDRANLAVAMTVRLLNPETPVLARAMHRKTAANMASFGTDHILNPFVKFGEYLALALASPGSYRLMSWLTGLPGTTLKPETEPPRGHWVVCGHGRFGREVVRAFRHEGLDVTVIDPEDLPLEGLRTVRGVGTEARPLREAGIERSVGIVAGTDDDVDNLSIAVTARELKKDLFTIVRQNLGESRPLFDAYDADITVRASEILANECIAVINAPLLQKFLDVVREKDDAWADAVVARLAKTAGTDAPATWGVRLSAAGAPAIHRALMMDAMGVVLGDLLRDPGERDASLQMVPIYLKRESGDLVLPENALPLAAGDEILFVGTQAAREAQLALLRNVNVRDYVLTGVDVPGGWIWQRLSAARPAQPSTRARPPARG